METYLNPSPAKPVTIGLIGAGRIGRMHVEHLATRIPGARLAAIADVNLEAAQAVAAHYSIPIAVANYQALLANEAINAVAICSATDTHAQIIQEAAAAGKHIFCEKPIDFNLRRIDETLALVDKSGVKFQLGFNRRFDVNFRRAHQMVADGKIGAPHILRITSRDPSPPPIAYIKTSGGIFLDMTIHDFDMARYLIGSEVVELYATGGVMVDAKIGEVGDLDTTVITLRFANGAIGTIDNSRQAVYGYDQRVEVFGSKGMVTVENPAQDVVRLSSAANVQTSLPPYFFLERYKDAYIAELTAFIAAVQKDLPPLVTGIDGRIPVVMGLAADKSYRENRVVRLVEIAG